MGASSVFSPALWWIFILETDEEWTFFFFWGEQLGHVEVQTTDGRRFEQRVEAVKGDPDNTLSREEIMVKGRSLAPYGGSAVVGERLERFFEEVWKLEEREGMRGLLE